MQITGALEHWDLTGKNIENPLSIFYDHINRVKAERIEGQRASLKGSMQENIKSRGNT